MHNENMTARRLTLLAAVVALLALTPHPAWAYAGPGSGLTVIGAALAFIGSVLLAIVGFIWYPIKRLLKRVRRHETPGAVDTAAD